jgi:hypothetical protein
VHNTAASRRREQAVAIGKERREALMRAKRVCRTPLSGSNEFAIEDGDMVIDDEKSGLETRTAQAVQELKSSLSSQYVPSFGSFYFSCANICPCSGTVSNTLNTTPIYLRSQCIMC